MDPPAAERRGGVMLRTLFVVHGTATLAAGVVLIVAPATIPASVDVAVHPDGVLVCYLLGATEIAIALLSFGARTIEDERSLRLVCSSFVVMHLVTCAVELYAYARGEASVGILANVALRVVIAVAFAWLGVHRVRA